MSDFLIECNKIKAEGKPATNVKLAVNGLTSTELEYTLKAVLLALFNTDETRQAFINAVEAIIQKNEPI